METSSRQIEDINAFDPDSDKIIPTSRALQDTNREKDFAFLDLNQIAARKQVFEQHISAKFGVTEEEMHTDLALLENELAKSHQVKRPRAYRTEYYGSWLSNNTYYRDQTIQQFTRFRLKTPDEYKLSKKVKKGDREEYLRRLYELGVVQAGLYIETNKQDDPRKIDSIKVDEIVNSKKFSSLDRYGNLI